MSLTPREQLLETAIALFARGGFHATGIDRLLAEAGVAKMTLYKHFKSKEDLILAALRLRDERTLAWLISAVEGKATSPRERLLALFDAYQDWFRQPDFAGCLFINACAEYAPDDDPVHVAAAEHKRSVLAYVRGLAEQAGAAPADVLARKLMLLLEGACVSAQVFGDAGFAADGRQAAEVLIDRAIAGQAPAT